MSIRYRLVSLENFDASDEQAAIKLLIDLGGFQHSPLANLSFRQWLSVLQHAIAISSQSILLQEAVRDPDFLEEYEAFYSKQQKIVSSFCRRLHFFASPAPVGSPVHDPANIVGFIDAVSTDDYLGFVTLRPLRHAPVGASILSPLPQAPITCKDKFPVHIAGREFIASGTPYLQQDNAVGACAQASIWVALRTLRKRLGNSAYSPAELTVAATKHYLFNRVFPGRDGLTPQQMLEAIRSAGHDPLIIDLGGYSQDLDDSSHGVTAIKEATPYLDSGLPVILGLNNPTGGHAVVAIGLGSSSVGNEHPDHLTIHNDNSGCYLDLPLTGNHPNEYSLNQAFTLIIPLPNGISMTAAEARTLGWAAIQFGFRQFLAQLPPIGALLAAGQRPIDIALRVFLSTRHAFRHWATHANDIDLATKLRYRTIELPRFIWVVEVHDKKLFQHGNFTSQSKLGEVILDAAADAGHGDGLLITRLSGLLLGENAPEDGILILEPHNSSKDFVVIQAPASLSMQEPWK